MTVTSDDIEYAIMSDRASGAIMLPRFTPVGWWECDVAELTDSGYFREYEIKVSRADFIRDAHKGGYVKTGEAWHEQRKTTKHELLSMRHKRAPNNFYFVMPENMIPVEDVPEWAGLIYVYRRTPNHWPEKRVVRRAPRIHTEKRDRMQSVMLGCAGGRLAHFYSQKYFRRHSQRIKIEAGK